MFRKLHSLSLHHLVSSKRQKVWVPITFQRSLRHIRVTEVGIPNQTLESFNRKTAVMGTFLFFLLYSQTTRETSSHTYLTIYSYIWYLTSTVSGINFVSIKPYLTTGRNVSNISRWPVLMYELQLIIHAAFSHQHSIPATSSIPKEVLLPALT